MIYIDDDLTPVSFEQRNVFNEHETTKISSIHTSNFTGNVIQNTGNYGSRTNIPTSRQ